MCVCVCVRACVRFIDTVSFIRTVPGQPAALMNGHVQAAPTDSTIKLSCNKVTSPIATPTSMMVATEAVLLGDTSEYSVPVYIQSTRSESD